MKLNVFNTILISLFAFLFFFTITHSLYTIYFDKNFDYLIESPCDPNSEKCFQRDCTNPGDCPPNNLSVYKEFYLTARYFSECTDNFCENLYRQNPSIFRPINCDENNGDTCIGLGAADTTEQ